MKFIISIFKKSRSLKRFKLPILVLLILEAMFIGWWSSKGKSFHAEKGYLVKNGAQYIVFWIDEDRKQSMVALNDLKTALDFVRQDLELEVATDSLDYHSLESIWIRSDLEHYSVFWKTLDSQYLNRLTFNSKEEATTFRQWFSKGAYTPSPIGHSVALKSVKKN